MNRLHDDMTALWGELTSLWDNVRSWVAFVIAPLAVPVIASLTARYFDATQDWLNVIVSISLMAGYLGTFLIGLPLYLLLRAFNLTAFWLAPAIGFVVGFAMTYLVALSLGVEPEMVRSGFWSRTLFGAAIQFGGPAGAVVGALLWLIARPDRQRRSVAHTTE